MDQDKTYVDGLLYAYKIMENYTKAGVYVMPVNGIMDKILTEIRSQSQLDLSHIEQLETFEQFFEIWHRP